MRTCESIFQMIFFHFWYGNEVNKFLFIHSDGAERYALWYLSLCVLHLFLFAPNFFIFCPKFSHFFLHFIHTIKNNEWGREGAREIMRYRNGHESQSRVSQTMRTTRTSTKTISINSISLFCFNFGNQTIELNAITLCCQLLLSTKWNEIWIPMVGVRWFVALLFW